MSSSMQKIVLEKTCWAECIKKPISKIEPYSKCVKCTEPTIFGLCDSFLQQRIAYFVPNNLPSKLLCETCEFNSVCSSPHKFRTTPTQREKQQTCCICHGTKCFLSSIPVDIRNVISYYAQDMAIDTFKCDQCSFIEFNRMKILPVEYNEMDDLPEHFVNNLIETESIVIYESSDWEKLKADCMLPWNIQIPDTDSLLLYVNLSHDPNNHSFYTKDNKVVLFEIVMKDGFHWYDLVLDFLKNIKFVRFTSEEYDHEEIQNDFIPYENETSDDEISNDDFTPYDYIPEDHLDDYDYNSDRD